MNRPKRPTNVAEPGYPTMAQHRSSRRSFLRRVAAGSLAVGAAGSLLTDCFGSTGGVAVGPFGRSLRLPFTGRASVLLSDSVRVWYVVSLQTFDERLSEYFEGDSIEALSDVDAILATLSSADLQPDAELSQLEAEIQAALEERYVQNTDATQGDISSLELLVCDEQDSACSAE